MLQSRAVRIAGLVLLAAAYCAVLALLLTFGRIPSQSPDMAFHLQLLEVVRGRLVVPPEAKAYLAEMYGYPRLSHRLAAVPSQLGLSSFNALTFAAAASAASLWLALFYQARRASAFVLWGALLAAAAAALLTAGLFGFEIVNNYFYPQLVSEAVGVLGLLAGSLLIRRSSWAFALFAPLAVAFCGWFHLMGVLKLAGGLAVLVVLEAARDLVARRPLRWLLPVSLAPIAAAVLLHPAFASMRALSANDGGISFAFQFTIWQLAACALAVAAIGGGLAWRSLRRGGPDEPDDFFISLGLAAAGAFLAQGIALAGLGEGSAYAVKKHAFGLFTSLAFLVPLALWRAGSGRRANLDETGLGMLALVLAAVQASLAVILFSAAMKYDTPTGGLPVETVRALVAGLAVTGPVWVWLSLKALGRELRPKALPGLSLSVLAAHLLMMHVIYARPSQLDVARISNVLEQMRDLRPRDAGGDATHLFVSTGSPPMVSFVANLAALRVDRHGPVGIWSAAAVGDADVRGVDLLVTETGDPTYDKARCRAGAPKGPVVVLHGPCVAAGQSSWDFDAGGSGLALPHAGWSAPVQGAIWTRSGEAYVEAPLGPEASRRRDPRLLVVLVGGTAPTEAGRTVRVAVAGGPEQSVVFNPQQAALRFVLLPVPPEALDAPSVRLRVSGPEGVGLRTLTLLP